MSERRPDDDLRARFQRLREHEARSAPDFDAVLRRDGAGRPLRRGRLWAPALAVAIATALVVALWPRKAPMPPETALWTAGDWAMPTDVLLELPGSELLRELPEIGREPGAASPPQSRRTRLERTIG